MLVSPQHLEHVVSFLHVFPKVLFLQVSVSRVILSVILADMLSCREMWKAGG